MKSANQLPAVSRVQSARFPEVTAKRSLSPRRLVALLLFALCAFAAPTSHAQTAQTVPADSSLIPAGINPGDSFRLLFVTSGTRDATSSEITDYNTFVQTQANAATGDNAPIAAFNTEFRALASTTAEDARDNTATTTSDQDAPIYWLNGENIADNYAGFYDGTWDSTVPTSQDGGTVSNRDIFTGSNNEGIEHIFNGLSRAVGQPTVAFAGLNGTSSSNLFTRANAFAGQSQAGHFYALSPIITVAVSPLNFGTATIPNQTYYTGKPVDFTLPPANGGIGTLSYTLTPTPSGLTFTSATRTLSSTPDTATTTTTTLTYTVTDAATPPTTASLTFSVAVLPPTAPTAAPTNVMLFPSDGEILVTWTRVDDANNGGRVITNYTATAIGGANTFCSSGGGSTCLATGLMNDTQYSVTVVATNSAGTSEEFSTPVTATPRAAPANTPPTAQTVPADFALKPDAIPAGGSFRLLFVTTAHTNPDSSHISLYNTVVQTSAKGGHSDIQRFSSEFRALISTETVAARDNTATTGVGVPIYWLNGDKVADDYAAFYDGDWDSQDPTDRSGGTWVAADPRARFFVWTGSNANGTPHSTLFAGSSAKVVTGDFTVDPIAGRDQVRTLAYSLYALSPVLTLNQAPTTSTVIPDQIAPIDIAFTYTFPETTFADADGIATLTYSASKSPDAAWLTFDSDSRTFSGTPTAADVGIITITVTASDGNASVTDEFTVTVTDTTTRLNEQILTRASQAMTASTMAAVAARVDAAADGAGATPTVAYQLGGQSSLRGLLESHGKAMLEGEMEYERLLDGASLVLPLAAADSDSAATAGAMAFWVGSDNRTLESNEDNLDWDGNVLAVHLGIDRQLSQQMMAGVALSWNQSGFDYQDEMDGSSGEYRYNSVNLHPYFGWYPSDELKLWGTLGYGQGEIEIETDEVQSTDSAQLSLSGGFSRWLLNSTELLSGGATTLNLKGDVSLTSVDVEEKADFAAQEVGSTRLRVLVSGEQQRGLASGGRLMPSLEVGVRYDGGDGVTGAGVELGGGLRYANPGGDLSVAGNVRTLLAGGYDELGVDVTVRLAPQSGRGLSLSLRPVWGKTGSAAERLWDEGASEITGGDTALVGSVDTEVGYGVAATMLGSPGVLTPYTGMTAQDGGSSRLRLGGRFVGGNGLSLNLEGVRGNTADGASHQVLLRGEVSF